jgi:hypothetical protein
MKPESFDLVIQNMDISETNKIILKERFINLLKETKRRAERVSIAYHIGHGVVTVGSLLVPAMLSIQYSGSDSKNPTSEQQLFALEIYWTTWVVSLLVTIFNGIVTLFKIDKKFLYLNTNIERLTSEGWQYAQLSGRYSGYHTPGVSPSHTNQFIFFCHKIEKIRMQQIDDEFHPIQEPNAPQASISTIDSKGKSDTMIPPTPLNPLARAKYTEEELNTILEDTPPSSPSLKAVVIVGENAK